MKLLLATTAIVAALGLMSFSVAPNDGVSRIGNQLYQIDLAARFSDADTQILGDEVARQYNLGDWGAQEGSVELDPKLSLKGKWIFRKKFNFMGMFEESLIKYDDQVIAPKDQQVVEQLNRVLGLYAR
jgi:hypothetical protein